MEMLVFSVAIYNILLPFGIFYGLSVIMWQFGIYLPHFGILCQEKSGNPGWFGQGRDLASFFGLGLFGKNGPKFARVGPFAGL
jgi:hypothetical protein